MKHAKEYLKMKRNRIAIIAKIYLAGVLMNHVQAATKLESTGNQRNDKVKE